MRRIAITLAMLTGFAGLAACNPNEPGMKVIARQCLAGGQAEEVCDCLSKQSAQRLDKDLFEMVVLGAQGEEAEVVARMEELPPELKTKFTVVIPDIRRECGYDDQLPG